MMESASKDMSIYQETFKQLVTKLTGEIDSISNKQSSNNQAPAIPELALTSPRSQLSSPQVSTPPLGSLELSLAV